MQKAGGDTEPWTLAPCLRRDVSAHECVKYVCGPDSSRGKLRFGTP